MCCTTDLHLHQLRVCLGPCIPCFLGATSQVNIHCPSHFRYADYHLYDSQRRHAMLATLLSKYTPDEDVDLLGADNPAETDRCIVCGEPQPADPSESCRCRETEPDAFLAAQVERNVQRADRREAARQAALAGEFADLDDKPYTPEQQAAVTQILAIGAGVVVLTGGPGSGKSFTIKKLTRQLRQQGKTVLQTASTGAAAARLSPFATTAHHSFSLPVSSFKHGNNFRSPAATDPLVEQLRSTDVIIIDEFSMLTANDLALILVRLFSATGASSVEEMLKSKLVILVGDHAQVRAGWG